MNLSDHEEVRERRSLSLTHTHASTLDSLDTHTIGTLVFAISDGAVPGSNGRNYVLRRVLRRAVRFGQQQLEMKPGFMAKLVSTVVSHMKSAFPEIEKREKYVTEVIRKEEETFNRTVKTGIRKFKQVVSKMKPGDVLRGEDAYKLWSTFGFPKELTHLMIEEEKMKMCTEESWNKAYKDQQEISRSGQKAADLTGMKLEANETMALEKQGVKPTDCSSKYEWHIKKDAKIMALYLGMGKFADTVKANDDVIGVVLDESSFYYTSGGQCTLFRLIFTYTYTHTNTYTLHNNKQVPIPDFSP